MNNDAIAKITMIKGSMRCFVFGLLCLVPFIGLPFGLLSLWHAGRVRIRERQYWNPARPYRIWGVVCAALGTVLWVLAGTIFFYNVFTGGWNNN